MKTRVNLLAAFLGFLSCFVLSGQTGSQNPSAATAADVKNSVNYVYIQTDRSYYLPGETIFFTSYFLDDLTNRTFPDKDTLNITIIDQDGLVIASGRYPVNNNIITGELDLPDLLTEGNYLLYAGSRSMMKLPPERIFSKIIEIKKSIDNYLVTDLSLGATVFEPGETLTAQLRFTGKDNKPVPASFSYQLLGKDEEILSGNNKANSDGFASLKIQLPKFAGKEILKLIVMPSYKGAKNITGVFIPTQYNTQAVEANKGAIQSSAESKHLNVQLKTINLSNGKNDKVQLEISVTDETGKPMMVNMSVSASNTLPHQLSFENDNILNYSDRKQLQTVTTSTADLKDYFTGYLIQKTQMPGHPYIIQDKNNAKKLHRKEQSSSQKSLEGYSSDRSIYDILMSIKPYHIDNGMIMFGIGTMNSVNSPEGALIVIDGVKMGTDAALLGTIAVPDIGRITASTNVMDIQRYSALNCTGVIEITMKKNKDFLKNEENAAMSKSSTLFWGPQIMTDNAGKASVSYFNNENSNEVIISVNAMSANGICGSNSLRYIVK
jgi:hypothetical protein